MKKKKELISTTGIEIILYDSTSTEESDHFPNGFNGEVGVTKFLTHCDGCGSGYANMVFLKDKKYLVACHETCLS